VAVRVSGDGELPYVRVLIETTGNLDLANVGRFLQRLDTGTRRVAQEQGWRQPSIEIVSITTSSLDLKIKIGGLRVAQASFAVSIGALALGVATYLKSDPAASKASYTLLNADRATTIIVEGGGKAHVVVASDVPPPSAFAVANRSLPRAPADFPVATDVAQLERLTGPQSGIVHHYAGENFVELDARPGLFISIRDERDDQSGFLEDMARYTFEGQAHVPPSGKSFYVVRRAIRLS
jgi:hypothetical protein